MSTEKFEIIVEKQYTNFSNKNNPTIALLMMCKNEHLRMQISLDSVIGIVDCMIVYDTGSTDDTVDIIKSHCEKHKINLYMIKGEFVNFCISRNVVLDYADTIDNVDFLLLLDVNDELRGGDKLKQFVKTQKDTENTGYLVCQHWWSGQYDKYFNMRLVKNKKGWRYRGSVHEWMKNTSVKEGEVAPAVVRLPDDIILYQDRTQDDDKSGKRFARDRELLLADYKKDPKEPRTLFYLAQTCSCLNLNDEALYYYKLRSELDGFQEEKFHAILRSGNLSVKLGHDWHTSMSYYMKAFEHSQRVEPLIKIAEYYKNKKLWLISFMFIQTACSLLYPEHCILFVDKHVYDYTRWHILGIVGYYCNQFIAGKNGCLKAIECGLNSDLDKSNLEFYEKKEKELIESKAPETAVNKKIFIDQYMKTLKQTNPKLKIKQLQNMANVKWKNRTNK